MKRFLSMLALAVLVLQSVATSAVYATDIASENDGSDSVPVVETAVAGEETDGSNGDEVVTDLNDSIDTTVVEEDTQEVEEIENVEEEETVKNVETVNAEEVAVENEEESNVETQVSYGKSFSSILSQSWRDISTNGLVVTAEDSLGAFPQGTEMVVTPVEEDDVFDLVNDAIEANVTKVKAVDITFRYDGEEVQPSQPINVTIRALDTTEPQTVVHIDTNYNEEKINVGEAEVEEIETDIKGKVVEFEAKSFSIYAIVDTARLLVNFYNGTGVITGMYVKAVDEVESLIFDPGVGELSEGKVFRGWTIDENYTTGSTPMTITGVQNYISENFETFETGVNIYAMVFNQRIVTYYDDNNGAPGVVLKTDEILYIGEDAPTYTVNEPYTPEYDTYNFEGWIDLDKTDVLYTNGEIVSLENNLRLKASVQEGHWLVFDENGKGGTYNAPRFIKNGEVTAEPRPASEMVRNGYTFGGWYKDAACTNGNEFTFGGELTDNTTIYAKWTTNTNAPYTILIWKQNVAGNGYDFEESITLSGTVRQTVNTVSKQGTGNNAYARVNNVNKQYVGFHLKEFDQNVTVNPEGNAVLNIYYDRTEYTLTFRRYQYNGTVYKTITAKYGQNIGNNFPISVNGDTEYRWEPHNSSTFNQVIVYIDIMPAENITFSRSDSNAGTKYMEFYVETLPGQTAERTYNGKNFVKQGNTIPAKYNFFTESEDFVELNGYNKFGSDPAFVNGRANVNNGDTLRLYYTRKVYPINFMDGAYYDGNGNKINTEEPSGQLHEEDNIVYMANLSPRNNYIPNSAPEGYVFEGWYIDDECTQPYTFTTMPAGGITVYAKWRQIQYRVFLHPNAGTRETNPSLTWGSDNQEMNFRVSYKGTISLPQGQMDGYEFVGWYADAGFSQGFSEKTQIRDGVSYDKETDFTEPMDKWGNGATTNGDIERFWITKKVDLYARWRSVLEGAEGINVVYVDNDGETEISKDPKIYVDSAEAVAREATSAPDNQQFKYWVVQAWNGDTFVDTSTKVYPGQSFAVLKTNASRVENDDHTEENPSYTYTVQLRAVYGDIESAETTMIKYCPDENTEDGCVDSETIIVNNEYTILGNEFKFSKGDGYVFSGWKDVKGSGYTEGDKVGVDNVNSGTLNVLYAQWDCDTDYHSEDGGLTCELNKKETTCITGTIANGIYVETGVIATWENGGWNVPVCTEIECDEHYELSGNQCNLKKYSVTYDVQTNGGTSGATTEQVEYNSQADLTKKGEKTDWEFIGWNTESSSHSGLESYTVTGDVTLYAIFKKDGKENTVTYTGDDTVAEISTGSDSCKIAEVYNNEAQEENCSVENKPTITCASGYNNGKLYDSQGNVVDNITLSADATYTAKCSPNEDTKYTVEHYFKGTGENTGYVIDKSKTQTLTGTTDAEVTATPLTEGIEGFKYNAEQSAATLSGKIEANGSLVLKVYYDRVESSITIDPNCEGSGCTEPAVTTGSYEDEIELPEGRRVYTLSYDVPAEATPVESQTVTATILGYCKGATTCDENVRIATGAKVTIEATPVTYYAVWSDTLTVTVASGRDYQTASTGYTFKTWKDGETPVATGVKLTLTGDKTLVAEYDEETRNYTITFINEDGTLLQSGEEKYGTMPVAPVAPTKTGDVQYTYTFAGWAPELALVTGDATYTATYDTGINSYNITFVDGSGNVIDSGDVQYGEMPTPPTVDTGANESCKTYSLSWSPEIQIVTGEATYTAVVDCTELATYQVTWNTHDGEYSGATYHYQDNLIVPENPQGYEDGLIAYTFSGWTPELVNIVTGDATYTAVYSEACITGYHYEQTEEGVKTCVSNEKEVETPKVCGELAKDSNAHYPTGTQTLTYTVNENGEGSWSDPICTAVCDDNYHEVKAEQTVGNDNEPVDVTTADGVRPNPVDGTAGETPENNETTKVNNFRCEIDTYTVTFDSNGGSVVTGQIVEYGKTATQPTTTRDGYNFKEWTLSGVKFDFNTPITGNITLVAQWDKVSNGGGGGGGGGGGSTKYYDCNTGSLPANASANNTTTRESSKIDYSYGTDSGCTFQCKSGYTWNGQECTKGGGGGNNDEEIELGGQVSDKCSVEGFEGSEEEKAAYLYACENDITTIRDINEARLKDFLTRAEMAKMVSVFATKELGMKPNTSKDCSNFANSIASYNQEMKDYMVMSCQLELMGIHTVNYEPIPDFMPSKRVSRAEFGTVLSRVLWGNKYEGTNSNYYINHLNALKENNIITNINPNITEYRAWVFLMLYRAVEAIKVLKSTNGVAIDQQVNEELQEEGKAETGLVVEYDSGSVVPDMATVTESGTLTTGSVVADKTGTTIDTQSGNTVTLSGDESSKEVSTGSVNSGNSNN